MLDSKSIASIFTTTLLTFSIGEATAATFNPNPLFKNFDRYETVISTNNDPADIYFPNPSDLDKGNYSFPVALLLQGALVDKSFYSEYASLIARYGFIVVVPNQERTVAGFTELLVDTSQIDAVLSQTAQENNNSNSPIKGIVDTEKLGLLGHSFGGAVGLSAIANRCLFPFCEGSFERREELKAGAFYGTNLRDANNEFVPIDNSGIAVALLQSDRDGVALPFRAEATYNNIQTPPKALITVSGANHFGITNVNNPLGAQPDSLAPTIPQEVAIETIARWSGLFLRANMLGDRNAFNYVFNTGDASDVNVTVASEPIPPEPIPEPSPYMGFIVLGALGIASYYKKQLSKK
jgi:dienelactone hydrolase